MKLNKNNIVVVLVAVICTTAILSGYARELRIGFQPTSHVPVSSFLNSKASSQPPVIPSTSQYKTLPVPTGGPLISSSIHPPFLSLLVYHGHGHLK